MVAIKLLVLFVGTLFLGLLLFYLLLFVALFVFGVPLKEPEYEHLEDARVKKSRNRIFAVSGILGFLMAGLFIFVSLFTDYPAVSLLGKFNDGLLRGFEIESSPLICVLSGVVSGVLWAVQWERFNAIEKAYNAEPTATVEQKYEWIRHERRNTLLASALVLGGLLLTLFYPGEVSSNLVIGVLVLFLASTAFVSTRW